MVYAGRIKVLKQKVLNEGWRLLKVEMPEDDTTDPSITVSVNDRIWEIQVCQDGLGLIDVDNNVMHFTKTFKDISNVILQG